MHWIVEPGFLSSGPVRTALIIGALASVLSSVTGVYVLLRRQAFAGHALGDVATAGGSGASLAGVSSLVGFVGASILGVAAMQCVGDKRVRGRDLATGIVLGTATGVSALLLFLASTTSGASNSTQQILFGSIFSASSALIPVALAMCVGGIAALLWCRGPLLLHSLSDELAAVRGVSARRLSGLFHILLVLAVSLASVVLGSILATALLIGPAAAALRVGQKMAGTILLSSFFGVVATSLGILLSYDSYYWSSSHRSLPVSFCVVIAIIFLYVTCSAVARSRTAKV